MKKIIVSVTNDLITDQRVAKVCNTLNNYGFKIVLVGRKFTNSKPLERNYKTKRFSLFFNKGFLFYAEYNLRLFFFLLFSKKDILLSNDLDTLLPNYFISKIQHKKLVFDSHELFSEIPELINRPSVKKIWISLENYIVPKLKNNYTVCKSIANYYEEKYNTNFEVIKNLPTKKTVINGKLPFSIKAKKVILYQGAINIGRGLDLLIDTLLYLENFVLVIIGTGNILEELKQKVSLKKLDNKVFFLGKLTPKELQGITPLANLGISLEEDLGLNYRYALPNKIFDYIQAEIPVLVSNLPEMKQVVLDYKVGEIVTNRTPNSLALQINKISTKDFSKQLKQAKETLIWENQEEKLVAIFKKLM